MKNYLIRFGSGSPGSYTGLSPTMTLFSVIPGGSALIGPTLTEVPTSTGLYTFQYEPAATYSIAFICDGGTSLSNSDRYVPGILDPVQAVDDKLGFSQDSIGTTNIDPGSMYSMLFRLLENLEGDGNFNTSTGIWSIQTRGGTLLRNKTLVNSSGTVTKT
jgi:hypothetical protein